MDTLNATAWEVLNATADDWENLEHLYGMLHKGAPGLSLSEVADSIHELVQKGLLVTRSESGGVPGAPSDLSYVWRSWFALSPQGKDLRQAAPSPSASSPRRSTPRGLWSDLGVSPVTSSEDRRRCRPRRCGGTSPENARDERFGRGHARRSLVSSERSRTNSHRVDRDGYHHPGRGFGVRGLDHPGRGHLPCREAAAADIRVRSPGASAD